MSTLSQGRQGVTLVELLLTVSLVVIAVTYMVRFFPESTKATLVSRQRVVATQLAQSLMQSIRQSPYDLIDPTGDTIAAWFGSGVGGAPGDCDCATADFAQIPADSQVTVNSVIYTLWSCKSYIDATYQSLCPTGINGGNDPGLKKIRVHVSWTFAGLDCHTDQQTMVSRL